ncbi:MAG: alpha/beta hydrolase [Rhodanobacteraceae bacterium]
MSSHEPEHRGPTADRQVPARSRWHGWRVLRRGLTGLMGLIALLAVSGATYNSLALRHLRSATPPPGKFYTVEGRRMHLYCIGSGSPTVVLVSGRAESFLVWGKVQTPLSRLTRVCAYDRAGLGWSDAPGGPMVADAIAGRLHGLLEQAGIDGPLVLMGHSAGGLYARDYAGRFPKQIAGLVLVDATSVSEKRNMPASIIAANHHGALAVAVFQASIALGIPRLMGQCDTPPPGFEATADLWRADACKPSYVSAYRRESAGWSKTLSEVNRFGSFGALPLLVLSRDPHPVRQDLPGTVSASDYARGMRIHDANQQGLLRLSGNSRRIIASGSGHYIHFQRPDLLVREAGDFIRHIREGRSMSGRGTTITE